MACAGSASDHVGFSTKLTLEVRSVPTDAVLDPRVHSCRQEDEQQHVEHELFGVPACFKTVAGTFACPQVLASVVSTSEHSRFQFVTDCLNINEINSRASSQRPEPHRAEDTPLKG